MEESNADFLRRIEIAKQQAEKKLINQETFIDEEQAFKETGFYLKASTKRKNKILLRFRELKLNKSLEDF